MVKLFFMKKEMKSRKNGGSEKGQAGELFGLSNVLLYWGGVRRVGEKTD